MYNVRKDKKYCSPSCANKAQRDRKNKGVDLSKKLCLKCEKEFKIIDSGYSRKYCYECLPKDSYTNGAQMRQIIKQWALEYKGNKCERCGYSKCSQALDFHHKNPNEKDFSLSDRDIILNWSEIKQEIDKCELLCANCHREEHAIMGRSD